MTTSRVDPTKYEWPGFDAVCQYCEDNELYMSIQPVWATDTSEVYEYFCPCCGVVDTYAEHWSSEDMDDWQQFIKGIQP